MHEQGSTSQLSEELKEKLSRIKILVMDVDGTLTDGSMYYSADGDVLKKFFVRDGMGIVLLHRVGIETAIVTTENSPIVSARAKKLGITHVILGSRNKKRSLLELSEKTNFRFDEMAFIGDDINDEFGIREAGVSACPSDAHDFIKSIVHIISHHPGGRGAVREFAEMILHAQGKPVTLPEEW